MSHLKLEAAPGFTHVANCCPVYCFPVLPWPNFSNEESALTVCTFPPPTLTCLHTVQVFICFRSCGIRFRLHSWHWDPSSRGAWLVFPSRLQVANRLSVIPLNRLPSETGCYWFLVPTITHLGGVSSASTQLRCHLLLWLPWQRKPFPPLCLSVPLPYMVPTRLHACLPP